MILIILLFTFFTILGQLIERPWDYILWTLLLVFFLLIYKISNKLITKNRLLRISALLISLFIFYFMIGAASIGYGSEHIMYQSDKKNEVGTQINYSFEYWHKAKIPTSPIKVIPIGGEGLRLIQSSAKKTREENFRATISFTIMDENFELPSKIIVIQRTLGVIPIISIKHNEYAK